VRNAPAGDAEWGTDAGGALGDWNWVLGFGGRGCGLWFGRPVRVAVGVVDASAGYAVEIGGGGAAV
jgi:hypothetical protein